MLNQIRALYNGLPVWVRQAAWMAVRGFVASMIILVPGVLASPSFSAASALAIAGVIAAALAALRALEAAVIGHFTA